MIRRCPRCGRSFRSGSVGHPKRWCTDLCRKLANREGIRATDAPPPEPYPLTALNVETTLRYLACGGKHMKSGEWIERDGRAMYICGVCSVPIPTRYYRPGMIRIGGRAA